MTLYRPADLAPDADERTFVVSTWSSSYKSSHFAGLIASEDWPDIMHRQIGKLIDRPDTRTLVACEPDGFLYGFLAGDLSRKLPIVHYVYILEAFRGAGYARGLFGALGVDPAQPFLYTCRTSVISRIADRYPGGANKIPHGKFVPAAARYTNYYHQESHGQRRS